MPNDAALPLWLPIAISALALAVSLVSLAWQVARYVLDGGRVVVKLRPAVWNPGTSVARMDSRTGAWEASQALGENQGVECAELVIENAGRTAVTISDPGVAYRGKRRHWWGRRAKHSVSPRLFGPADHIDSQIQGAYHPVRLDPYSRVVYLLDIHSVIEMAREVRAGAPSVSLRGRVVVAGLSRPVLSSRRRRWRVPSTARTLADFAPIVPVERAILLVLIRHRLGGLDGEPLPVGGLEYASRLIAARLWGLRNVSDINDRVSRALDDKKIAISCGEPVSMGLVEYYLEELLTAQADHLSWTGAEIQHGLEERARARRAVAPPTPPTEGTGPVAPPA